LAVELQAPSAQLRLLCLFHLNLAFSSLEEEVYTEVIHRCYRPALELARETGFPVALEATGWTLRRIAQLDPGWIELLRELLAQGRVEFVGSAHAQCAAPLLPARVNAWNLRLGREVYEELLGVAPRIALVCEQVYSPGLVPLYLEAGYEALIVDWDNARRSHPQWPEEYRLHPQRARGGGRSIPIVWSKSIAFQKFQRFAHGELSLERYLGYVRGVAHDEGRGDLDRDADDNGGGDAGRAASRARALMLYANDVEIFDHRPGRFAAEPDLREGEWQRIATGLRTLSDRGLGVPALPSEMLGLLDAPGAGVELELESPSQPIPVKKQDKYNVSRWAVSGRDDVGINTRCWRLYEHLRREGSADPARWRELCELWASDFRTHITQARWDAYLERLGTAERLWLSGACDEKNAASGVEDAETVVSREEEDILRVRHGSLAVRLNLRRGLAIEAFSDARVAPCPLFGTLEHGYFPTIELGADFYSGHLVQESPLTHKVTDLERVEPAVGMDARGRLCVLASIATELGPIEKAVRLDSSGLELEWALRWPELPLGSLRLGHVTLLPEAFHADTLWMATHNGGSELERHSIAGPAFDHGAAVSALVSCRQGLGLTEGVLLLGDATRAIRVEVDQNLARPLGLLAWRPGTERWFLRLCFALTESDDTRRGAIPREPGEPQRMRLRISALPTDAGGAEAAVPASRSST
jgi:Glycosyl hydrolase family 57